MEIIQAMAIGYVTLIIVIMALVFSKRVKQKIYIEKVAKTQGTKGLQKLVNQAIDKMVELEDNNLSTDEKIAVSKMLSQSIKD